MRRPARDSMEVVVLSEGGVPPLPRRPAEAFLRALGRRLRAPHHSVAALFTDDDSVRGMNRRYRGKDRVTDVLSFPSGESGHLGDIAIASTRTRRQARASGRSAPEEARRLLLHGFLHLLGYDHETDDGEMQQLERTLRLEMRRGAL